MNLSVTSTVILATALFVCTFTRDLHMNMFGFRVVDGIFLWGETRRFLSFDPKENVNNTGEGPQKMKHNV